MAAPTSNATSSFDLPTRSRPHMALSGRTTRADECPLMTHFGHQRHPYGPGVDRARALYLECCTCRSVRGPCSQERQEFAPDQVESSRRGYGVRGINLGEEIE